MPESTEDRVVFESLREWADRNDFSHEYSRALARDGKIPGARRVGHAWVVVRDGTEKSDS